MRGKMKYNIHNLVGDYCVTPQCGQALHDILHPLLVSQTAVELDFSGIKAYGSPFFNYAVGQLLKDISLEEFRRLVNCVNLSSVGTNILEMVLETAQQYYSDDSYRQAVDAVREEELASC
jgi:STAS-like domain of unknown function (DUF4325)